MDYKFISVEECCPFLDSPLQINEFGYVKLAEEPEKSGKGFYCKEGDPLEGEKPFSRFHLCLNDNFTEPNVTIIGRDVENIVNIIRSDYKANHQVLPTFFVYEFNDFVKYFNSQEKLKLKSIFDCYNILISSKYPTSERATIDESEMLRDITQGICKKYKLTIAQLIKKSNARRFNCPEL